MAQAELLQRAPMLIDVSDPRLYQDDTWRPSFARLRRDDAVHYCGASAFARNDVEFAGRKISSGDKVVMWYISGNRDEEKIDRADEFIIDRAKPQQHLSFGAGIHRCVGDRLAEQQLRILWEEILQRNFRFEIVGAPRRLYSNFIRGIPALPVRIVSSQPK